MAGITYRRFNNPRDNRLVTEHQLLDSFCQQSPLISYEAIPRKGGLPPERYLIHYRVKSIVGIDVFRNPVYGYDHTAEIVISPEYPLGGQPSCFMKTQVWHPNIKFDGHFAGKICVNKEALGHWHTLDMMAERIGEMLQWKNYHAVNTHPFPEDANVAAWVREYAEPNNIVNKQKGLFIDDRPLLKPSEEWLQTRKEIIEVTILGIRKPGWRTEPLEDDDIFTNTPPASKKMEIIISRRN